MQKYELNRSISIKKVDKTSQFIFGQTQNKCFTCEYSKEFEEYIKFSLTPFSFNESIAFLENLGMKLIEAISFTNDLISKKILTEVEDKISRYDRHKLYFSFEEKNLTNYEEILKNKCVMILGCGGIGSNCAQMLASSGIGNLVLVDSDKIELTNLPRTLLFDEEHLGQFKVDVTKRQILKKQSKIQIHTSYHFLNSENLNSFANEYSNVDFIILSGDSTDIHIHAEQLSKLINAPIINAGYVDTFGVVGPTVLPEDEIFFLKENQSTYLEQGKELNSRLQAPSYGPLNFLVSSIAVNEAIRYFLGLKVETNGIRLVINSFNYCIEKQICFNILKQESEKNVS